MYVCMYVLVLIVIICLDWDSLDRPLWLLTVSIFLCSYVTNKVLGIINHNVVYKSKEVISKLYNSYVRPARVLCTSLGSTFRKYINMLERVQCRATRMISVFEERLKE